MNKQQAKGYLLEIVLSKLIEVNGYEVITEWNIPYEPELPPEEQEIRNQSNGLNIKGRGGYHQFDTLGTFIGTGRKTGIFSAEDERMLEECSGFSSKMDKALFADAI